MPDISGLYPQPQQPQQQQQGALTGNMSQMLQLVQAAKTLKAKQILGDAYQNAIKSDGSVDLNSVATQLKNDPNASFILPEATSTLLDQHSKMIANGTSQFVQDAKQTEYVQQMLARRANQAKITDEDLNNDAVSIARNTNIPSSRINAVIDSLKSEPRGIRFGVQNLQNLVMGAGQAAQPVDAAPGPDGEKQVQPLGAAGYGTPARPVGLPQGSEVSSQAMQGDLQRAGNYGSDIYPLKQALDLATKLGPGGMAPGSKGRQDFESFVYGLMPSLVPQGMQDKIKNYAELEKYLINNASQRANNLGPHTNDGLAAATSGSPNVHINDLAGVDLIKAQIGLRRMEHAQTLLAAQSGGPKYNTSKAAVAASLDPRAFTLDMMTPEQITKLDKSLKGAERVKFNASLKAARDSGVIQMPEATNAGQ